MWPPSMPIRTAIFPWARARRTSSAVVASASSSECRCTCSRTASIRSSARLTPFGPFTWLGVQMDMNTAFKPPSRIRGMSRWPSASRFPRSNFSNNRRCGVSTCVSNTMALACSCRARSTISSAGTAATSRPAAASSAPVTSQAKSRLIASPIRLSHQPAEQRLPDGLAIDFGDGLRQWDLFRANLHAVLCVGAIRHPARSHHGLQALACVHRAGGMHVEETHLADDGGSDERIVLVHLGTYLEASATGDASREGIGLLLVVGRHAGAFAQVVSAVNRHPGLHPLQIFKHDRAVHREIANHRELRHRLEANGLHKLVHQSRAGHARLGVDQHGARPADFLQAVRLVGYRCGLFPVAGDGMFGDVAQTDDHVHVRAPSELELLPARTRLRAGLPLHPDDDFLLIGHTSPVLSARFT